MPLPFLNGERRKLDQIIAIDLGTRSTKAVHMQRKGDVYTLFRYVVMDAPIFEKTLSVELLAEHLKAIHKALETKTKIITLAVGPNDAIIRQTEMPQIPVEDMRQVLRNSPKAYLQQELPGYTFDCWIMAPAKKQVAAPIDPAKGPMQQKHKVLVGGAKKQLIDDLNKAAKEAGLIIDQMIPGLVGPVNAFEVAMTESFMTEAVALVDIGFKNTTICLLNSGEMVVSRVVNIGGDRLTSGLAEGMNISYAEAESIKVGMPVEVQANLDPLLAALARELRASIDFFEHQQDKPVARVYVSGGSARSEFIVRGLEAELMVPCVAWNPLGKMEMALPPVQLAELEQAAPQLAVAVGAGVAAL